MAVLAAIFALLAILGCLQTVAALLCLVRFARQTSPVPSATPPVTILKPLYGDEPRLYENLASVLVQDYSGPVRVVFGVARRDDPAAAVVERLIAGNPAAELHLVVDPRRHGRNGKVSNLVNLSEAVWPPEAHQAGAPLLPSREKVDRAQRETDEGEGGAESPLIRPFGAPSPARGEGGRQASSEDNDEIVVLADSDMLVGPDYLARLVGALEQPGVGGVTCLYRGVSLPNLWSRLATGWVDGQFLPNVILGLSLGLAKPCMGSTIALRRATLERIGGFAAFADLLADDYEIGAAIRRLGLTVVVPSRPVLGHTSAATSLGALLRQELRWTRTIKTVDFAGFAGSVVTHVLPFALLTALADGFRPRDWLLLLIVLLLRLSLVLQVKSFVRKDTADLSLLVPRDLLSFAVFIASFWPGSIEWRGHRFGVRSDGIMIAPDDTGH